jgi:hypothetical protein
MVELSRSMNRFRVPWMPAEMKYWIRRAGLAPAMALSTPIARLLYPLLHGRLSLRQPPIFIIGCSRSGTTVFLDCLLTSGMQSWSEAPELFAPDYWNVRSRHRKGEADVTPGDRARIRSLVALRVAISGGRRFVNKHPENSLRIPWVLGLFPDAVFLHLIRDPRAVVRSSLSEVHRYRYRRRAPLGFFPRPDGWQRWEKMPLHQQFAHQWVELVRQIQSDRDALRLDTTRYMELRFEDFCSDVPGTLERCYDFIGLPASARPAGGVPIEKLDPQESKWRGELTPKEVSDIESICAVKMKEFGYTCERIRQPEGSDG